MKSAENRRYGALAEDFAAEYLVGLGHEILSHNFAVRGGEIDIISLDGEYIVFTEVKMRRSNTQSPLAAMTPEKASRIMKCADVYLQTKNGAAFDGRKVRIDVVALTRDGADGGFRVFRHIMGIGMASKTARRF